MMATHRTPADGEALCPAIRILVKRVMADSDLSAASRWLLLEGREEAPRADTPERRAVLEGGRTDLSAEDDLPSFREHIRMLEVIRDRALAKGRESTALSAEDKIGKAMGYNRPRGTRADRIVRANVNPPSATAGGGQGGGGDALAHGEFSSPPPPRPSPTPLSQREGGERLAGFGAIRPRTGRGGQRAGRNWLELARIG